MTVAPRCATPPSPRQPVVGGGDPARRRACSTTRPCPHRAGRPRSCPLAVAGGCAGRQPPATGSAVVGSGGPAQPLPDASSAGVSRVGQELGAAVDRSSSLRGHPQRRRLGTRTWRDQCSLIVPAVGRVLLAYGQLPSTRSPSPSQAPEPRVDRQGVVVGNSSALPPRPTVMSRPRPSGPARRVVGVHRIGLRVSGYNCHSERRRHHREPSRSHAVANGGVFRLLTTSLGRRPRTRDRPPRPAPWSSTRRRCSSVDRHSL